MSSSKDKQQKQQEKFQAILSGLLREEDNKYCADCEAKGPRWASWNLGVFLCIRCAGIHRNLGVHISRVKSVNLDQWTAEQITSMQAMGNSKARAIYECNLSDNFRRSQTDSAMEQFIRQKYETRKWIDKEWVAPALIVSPDLIEDDKEKRKTSDSKRTVELKLKPNSSSQEKSTQSVKKTVEQTVSPVKKVVEKQVDLFSESSIVKPAPVFQKEETLLDFDSAPVTTAADFTAKPSQTTKTSTTNEMEDLFSNMNLNEQQKLDNINPNPLNNLKNETNSQSTSNVSNVNLIGDLMFTPIANNQSSNSASTNSLNSKIDKNSILALYSTTNTNSPQMHTSQSFHQLQQQQPQQQNKMNQFQQSFPVQANHQVMGSASMLQPNQFSNLQQTPAYNPNQQFASLLDNISSLNQASSSPSLSTMKSQNNMNNLDLFSFDSFSSKTNNGSMPSQVLPNIGNTLSSDLWQ